MAETAESSKENSDAPVAMTDRDFDVNPELMVHDMDDEATLDEEETLEAGEGFNERELDDLQKEAKVPIEDLWAMYYNAGNQRHDVEDEEDDDGHTTNIDVPLDDIQPEPLPPYDHADKITHNGLDLSPNHSPLQQDSADSQPASPQGASIPPENQRITRGLAAAYQYYPDTDSSSSDEDYSPREDWKKEVQIGPDHQAEVPETTCPVDSQESVEQTSKCLWSPKGISEQQLQKYMNSVCGPSNCDGESTAGMGRGDDEQALYVLLQCNYNYDEAIKKFESQPPPSEEMTFWSEEECRNFELGLRTCGKDFYSIQQTKVTFQRAVPMFVVNIANYVAKLGTLLRNLRSQLPKLVK